MGVSRESIGACLRCALTGFGLILAGCGSEVSAPGPALGPVLPCRQLLNLASPKSGLSAPDREETIERLENCPGIARDLVDLMLREPVSGVAGCLSSQLEMRPDANQSIAAAYRPSLAMYQRSRLADALHWDRSPLAVRLLRTFANDRSPEVRMEVYYKLRDRRGRDRVYLLEFDRAETDPKAKDLLRSLLARSS